MSGNDFESLSARAVSFSLFFPLSPGVGQSTQQVLNTCGIKRNSDLPLCRVYGISLLNDGALYLEKGGAASGKGVSALRIF